MQLYYDRGIREFMFFDDMFNLPAKRALAVSQAIRKHFPDVKWCFRGRADQITEELGEELSRSNCKQVSVGAEAHTDEAQKELRTGKTVENVVETKVYFKTLTEEDIENYLAVSNALDRAGAYAIQDEESALLIERFEGDYANAMGFPVDAVLETLKQFISDI